MINHQDLLFQSGTLNSVQRSSVLATNLTAISPPASQSPESINRLLGALILAIDCKIVLIIDILRVCFD